MAFDRPPLVWTRTDVSATGSAAGTVTVSCVSEADVTAPGRSPKRTVSPSALESKPVPMMLIVWPGSAFGGVTDVMTGPGGRARRYSHSPPPATAAVTRATIAARGIARRARRVGLGRALSAGGAAGVTA